MSLLEIIHLVEHFVQLSILIFIEYWIVLYRDYRFGIVSCTKVGKNIGITAGLFQVFHSLVGIFKVTYCDHVPVIVKQNAVDIQVIYTEIFLIVV